MSETAVSEGRETAKADYPPRINRRATPARVWLSRPQPRRADETGVPLWKSTEKRRTKPKTEEIAKLWMNENSIVNQKAAYFTAVNGAMFIALKDKDVTNPDFLIALCWVGMLVCIAAFVSISRTCAYRA